jgi:hypothetical protein|tara:strand:- start:49 stop:555 length:507 start_codon:yes stop_codon:yes gene_type:complete
MKAYILIILFTIKLVAVGQVQTRFPKIEIKTPLFKDSTLLFFSDTLTWECKSSKNDSFWYSYQLYKIDYNHLDSCNCYHGIYLKAKSNGFSSTYYKEISKNKYGSLIKTKENNFKYTENRNFVKNPREILYKFSIDSIVISDTIYVENEWGDLIKEVHNYFNVTQLKK